MRLLSLPSLNLVNRKTGTKVVSRNRYIRDPNKSFTRGPTLSPLKEGSEVDQ